MRLLLATLWILIGGALTAGVYWGFLITPESTVWMLLVSALLAVLALAVAGLTAAGAIAIWSHGFSISAARSALRSIPAVVPAAAIVWLVWWSTGRAEAWVTLRSGSINAWFIAQLGWDDVRWIFTTVHFIVLWCRWVLAAMLALSLMTGFVTIGWTSMRQRTWLQRALSPRALVLATLAFVALIGLPWTYLLPWRPPNLPPTSIEYVFIVTKLSVSAILFAIGAALIVKEAARVPSTPIDPSTAVAAVSA